MVIRRTVVTQAPPAPIAFEAVIGAPVPETVVLQPVPQTLVTAVPNATRYRYTMVNNQVVFVDPSTQRVVAVIRD